MVDGLIKPGTGYVPDPSDSRDYTVEHPQIKPFFDKMGSISLIIGHSHVDLRKWCSPISNQLSLESCCACSGVGILEYFENKTYGKYLAASRRFLFKVTRELLHRQGNVGVTLRDTMKSMVLFGLPPEEYWPYSEEEFDIEPSAFVYAYANNYNALKYYRLDPPDTSRGTLLRRIKTLACMGLPSMFGMDCYDSFPEESTTGKIPFPAPGEGVKFGHAMVVVGYDDRMKIMNPNPGGIETTGAFLIRNSWGTGWGDNGYGWLPYKFILEGVAVDWWSLLKNEWLDNDEFI
ncbi:C1 family peptidase [Desulfosporosinus burensis]